MNTESLSPIRVLLVVPTAIEWMLILTLLMIHPSPTEHVIFWIWSLALGVIAFYIASGLILTHAPLAIWLHLTAIPLFLFWKIAVCSRVIAQRSIEIPSTWIRIGREKM